MTLDDITAQLRTCDLPPHAALRAAVGHAEALAPLVYIAQEQFCRGVCLRPEDERLLVYGLHVLAAARHPELWPRLVALMRVSAEGEVEGLFMDHASTSLAALGLSVWDGDTEALLRLIEHAEMGEDAKWALFDILARLTCDGSIARETTCAFLERYERENLADDDSMDWWGWDGAVTKLGLVELEPALRRVWQKPVYEHNKQHDFDERLEIMRSSAAAPSDASAFDVEGICTVDDPADALVWMERQAEIYRRLQADHEATVAALPIPPHILDDPAQAIKLTDEEEFWLARFLVSRQVPPTTMPFEVLDGFLTALAIGPGECTEAKYLPHLWGEQGVQAEPEWADDAQATYVKGLIARNAAAIAQRIGAGAQHVPMIDEPLEGGAGAVEWAEGFALGMELDATAWNPLFEDKRGAEDGLEILALCEGETEFFGRPATPLEKSQITGRLPRTLQRIAAYWKDPAQGYPRAQPIRVSKVGRNDPCPCGSGKKFKKCCALKTPLD